MNKSKVPDTCAKCNYSSKWTDGQEHGEGGWLCTAIFCKVFFRRIPCARGRLPLPLKSCPLKGKAHV